MSAIPRVSIIIPAYNEAGYIIGCLKSCLVQTIPAQEIIVVNNRSTDDTVQLVKGFMRHHPEAPIRLLEQNELQGLIPTRNYGFEQATGDVLGRIDADSEISPGWVEEVTRLFSDPSVMGATGPVVYYDMPAQKTGLKVDSEIRAALDKLAKDHRFLFGSNMAIRKSAWELIKPFAALDEKNELHEDIDLALCLHKQGCKVIYSKYMIGSMSARRLEDRPRDFFNYVMRYERTYRHHNIDSATARIPIFIYLSIYFPTKIIRSLYDPEKKRFTTKKLQSLLLKRIR